MSAPDTADLLAAVADVAPRIRVFTLQIPTVAVVIVCALAACAAGIGWISLTTMLASESPAGAATTMTLNVSIFCVAGAASTAFAGLVLVLDGYRLLGVVFPLFVLASAALLWRPWTARVSPLRYLHLACPRVPSVRLSV